MASRVVWELPISTLEKQRQLVTTTVMKILHAYRKHCAPNSSTGQLILPESLKLMPLYTMAYIKSAALLSSTTPDDRASALANQCSSTTARFMMAVMPRLVNIAQLQQDDEGVWLPKEYLTLSSSHLNSDGMYLLENGVKVWLQPVLLLSKLNYLFFWIL